MRLIEYFGTPEEMMESLTAEDYINTLDELLEKKMFKPSVAQEIKQMQSDKWFEKLMKDLDRTGIKVVTLYDEEYPERLRMIPDSPLAIYYRGNLSLAESEYTLGMVGSRRPTFYGMGVAEEFATELARKGIVIVSGMAMGIDARSHQGAVRAGGKTIAVLGGGVDICYPRTNIDIFLEMCQDHLVLSEYEPGEEHKSLHFPLRNRIISGLSDGLLVVEAALRSGTLITVDYALEQGKEIYAIPGRVGDMMSKGANSLIKKGAMLVDSPVDIILNTVDGKFMKVRSEIMNGTTVEIKNSAINAAKDEAKDAAKDAEKNEKRQFKTKSEKKKAVAELPAAEQKILGMLGYEPVYIDEIIRANNMDISGTLQSLRNLEDKGYVKSIEQSYYILA